MKKELLVSATMLVASVSSYAEFASGMYEGQIAAEVAAATSRGDSITQIMTAAVQAQKS